MANVIRETTDFEGRVNVSKITATDGDYKGQVSYMTQSTPLLQYMKQEGAVSLLPFVSTKGKSVLFLVDEHNVPVKTLWLSPKKGLTLANVAEKAHALAMCESWNPGTRQWVPMVCDAHSEVDFSKAVRIL